ncbi:MAG: Multi-sensor signal transduction histidine kinase [Pedosphaera sp.]|nr:Multi-sensor signal transduction histidine kinase [Pedosphaera sp.]
MPIHPLIRTEVRANILVVNDRPEQLVALGTVLAVLEENVVMAQSGEEALRQLLHHEFAVVLLDVHMPGMDGFETASLIRQRKRSRSTPIIFVTAHGQGDAQVARSYALGAVDYIQTPIVPEILRTKVGVFVELYKKSEELRLVTEAEHQRQLDESKKKLEAETKRNLFFVLSIDLLAVAGFDGYFKQTNPAWEKVLGFTDEELKAKAFYEFAHPEDQAATQEQLEKLKAGTAITYFENRFCCKGGHYRWLGWTAAPFAADQLVYIFARDITERKVAEDKIRTLNQKLQVHVNEVMAINQELETFSYSISHDLRAPLRSMQGFAQMLAAEYGPLLPEQAREFTNRIVESSRRMDRLLRDLLEYSRLSQSEIKNQPVNPEVIVDEVLGSIQSEIRDKHAEIEVNRPLASLLAHAPTLKQILANLIANALKFVEPGKAPHIRIYTEADNGTVRLWVEDNGIGISSDQHEKIFGLFQRLHDAETYPGTGIGLAIVRKSTQRMGGRSGVESTPGQGSRFWLELSSPEGSLTKT